MSKFQLNTRVIYLGGGKPAGTIIAVSPPLKLNGVVISQEKYMVKYDDQEEGTSGWLSAYDLKLEEDRA